MKTRTAVSKAVLALVLIGAAPDAHAARSADDVCRDVAAKAKRTLWSGVRETGDQLFCRKGWVTGRYDEYAGCTSWTLANKVANRLANAWNAHFDAAAKEWATWGPRGLGAEPEQGTIRGGFKRTFFGPALAYMTTQVHVKKRGGRAEATITACRLDQEGKVASAEQRSFENGPDGVGTERAFAWENEGTFVLGLVVDTPASVNAFEYEVRLEQEPIRNDLGAVHGLADLHVHQFMNLGMGGRFYWGSPSGDPARALGPEVVSDQLGLSREPTLDELLSKLGGNSIHVDANRVMKLSRARTDDEGRFTLGTSGAPGFEDWPNHKDRSHQQVHVSWLKEAHERRRAEKRNLQLIVVSIVNNDVLCGVMKALDQYGNVPRFDASGKITGWESAPWGCTDDENVMRQIAAVHQLERDHSWYRVAMTPWHARQIIADGDLAVVLSLETDKVLSGKGGSYGNWKQQLDAYRALGVTTLQVVHESNNRFAGAALHRDDMKKLQAVHWPIASIGNLLRAGNTYDVDEKGHNRLGLTAEGEELVDALVARNIPIDLAHSSVRTKQQIFRRVPKGYALYESHTKFERLLDPRFHDYDFGDQVIEREKELVVPESLLAEYKEHQVLLGLRAASIDVYDAPRARVKNDCPGSARSFAQQVQYATDNGLAIAYGNDWNTGVSQLGPRFGAGACWAASEEIAPEYRTRRPVGPQGEPPAAARQFEEIAGRNYWYDGMAHIGMLPELTTDLVDELRTPGADRLTQGAEAFLKMWERAFDVPVAEAGSGGTPTTRRAPRGARQ